MTTALEKPDMNTEELLAGQTITPAEEEQNSVQSTSRLSREEIIDSLRKLVEGSVEEVKDEVDELKQAYYKQKKIEIEEARNAFIAAGNPGGNIKVFVICFSREKSRIYGLARKAKRRKFGA